LQPGWPHWQEISVLPDNPSQWALQYFEPGAAEQLQTGFAHLEALAMNIVLASGIPTPWHGLFEYDAGRWTRVACAAPDALL